MVRKINSIQNDVPSNLLHMQQSKIFVIRDVYYMAQMVGVLWLAGYRSVTCRYGPENFICALWLVNELGNNILVMDWLWLSAVWLSDGAHFLARALHLRNTKALVNIWMTGRYDKEKTAH